MFFLSFINVKKIFRGKQYFLIVKKNEDISVSPGCHDLHLFEARLVKIAFFEL